MKSFESYLLQKTSDNTAIKNLQTGDKIKYIRSHSLPIKGTPIVKPNNIYTFLEVKEVLGRIYVKIKENNYIIIRPSDIIKV